MAAIAKLLIKAWRDMMLLAEGFPPTNFCEAL